MNKMYPKLHCSFYQRSFISKLLFIFLISLSFQTIGFSQLLQWNTFNNAGTETTEPSVTNNANVGSSPLTLGAGITPASNGNRFGGSNWFNTGNTNPSTLANAIAGNDYIEFTVTPNAGITVSPSSLVFNFDRSNSGPATVTLRSSADGYTANLGTTSVTGNINTVFTINITGLSFTTATTFRLYGYGGTNTGGTGGFDTNNNAANVTLNGTAVCTAPPVITSVTATQIACPTPTTGSIEIAATGNQALGYSINGGTTYQAGSSFTGLTPGNYTVRVRTTAGCVTTFASNPVVINPAPTFTIAATAGANGTVSPAGNTTVACGSNSTYTITPASCFVVSDVIVDGVSQGAITTYTFTNNTANHTISATFVSTLPVISAPTVTQTDCPSPLTGTIVANATGNNLEYSLNGGAYQESNTFSGLTPGNYNLQVRSSVGCVSTYNANPIVINAVPTYTIAATAGANGTISPSGTATVSCGSNNTYTITPAQCFVISDVVVDGTSVGAVPTYTFSATSANHTINATFEPAQPLDTPDVSGPKEVCDFVGTNTQVTYTVAADPAVASYLWQLPANVTLISGQGTNTLTVTFDAGFQNNGSKQLRVTALSPCGNSAVRIYYLNTNNPKGVGPITAGSTDVCAFIGTNNAISYSISPVLGATSYIWSAQAGTTTIFHAQTGVNDTTVLVTFTNGFTTSAITVQAANNCGVSSVRSFTIIRNNPSKPGIISGPTNACAAIAPNGTAATYTLAPVAGATSYTWTAPAGSQITYPNGQGVDGYTVSILFPQGLTTGTLSVTANNNCGSSVARTLSLNTLFPSTPGAVTVAEISPCPNRIFTYSLSATPLNSTSVMWTVPTGGTILSGNGTNSITVSYTNDVINGVVTAMASSNCGNSAVREVNVNLAACRPAGAERAIPITSSEIKVESSVYPNPSPSSFNLRIAAKGNTPVVVRVLNATGTPVLRIAAGVDKTINFGSSLLPGIYFVETVQGQNKTVQRIVKY